MQRAPGPSVRLKLTLSYVGFLLVAVVLLLAIVWVFLLRYVPAEAITTIEGFVPGRDDLVRAFAPALGWVLLCLAVFAIVGGWFLAGRMLAPLRRLTAATRKAADGSLSHRVELEGRRDEFRELSDSFDEMLARLEAHLAEQQRFAANASHELRTPLAITQTLLDVARDDPATGDRELIERLRLVNTRAIELTEALLLLSRADGRAFARERVDLSLLADETVETLLPLAEARQVTLEAASDVAIAIGSTALLQQLTTNLVHNAIVHNLSDGGIVRIATAADPDSASLTVENTGAQLSPQMISTLTEPFRRGTGRIRGDHAGVGLGLAIAKSIVQAHDGTMSIAAREGGGLRVVVRLPSPSSPDPR